MSAVEQKETLMCENVEEELVISQEVLEQRLTDAWEAGYAEGLKVCKHGRRE